MNALILSYAQDTNGQNARFVEAAKKHGRNITAFAIGKDDPAGVVGRFQQAAAKRDGLSIRSAHRVTHYFEFPGDIIWDHRSEAFIRTLAANADVLHLNNSPVALTRLRLRPKPTLIHHHGSMFRNGAERLLAQARHGRWVSAVSTIDLLRFDPERLRWLPSAYDIGALQAYGAANRREPDGKVRVLHAPTNRRMKHTELLIQTVRDLQAEGLPVELQLVEGQTNAEVLAAKAQSDIVFDQLAFGYGCNSIEAWGLGLPVIAGADEWTLVEMERRWGSLPFALAYEDTLRDVLADMVTSENHRFKYAKRGLDHVLRYHDEQPALETLAELYIEALDVFNVHRSVDPVTFRKTTTVRIQARPGEPLPWGPDGRVTVTDPDVIQHLRNLTKRSIFGITEEVA